MEGMEGRGYKYSNNIIINNAKSWHCTARQYRYMQMPILKYNIDFDELYLLEFFHSEKKYVGSFDAEEADLSISDI